MRPLPGTAPHCSPSMFWHAVEPLLLLLNERGEGDREGDLLKGALEIPSSRYSRISDSRVRTAHAPRCLI